MPTPLEMFVTTAAKKKAKKPFVPFEGDPKKDRPTKKESRDEIDAIRKSGLPDSKESNWMNDPKVAARTNESI